MKTTFAATVAAGLLAAGASLPVTAHEAGDWIVRGGFHYISPKSNNARIDSNVPVVGGAKIEVDEDTMFTFDVTYMMTRNWGVELLAAAPFEHDIQVGGAKVASTKHLPPTLSVVYAFMPDNAIQPYAGLGLNMTVFFDENIDIPGADLNLDTSLGLAAVAGVDIDLGDNWFLNADIRYLDIETDAKIFIPGVGTTKPTVEIDPWAFGLNVGFKF
ncbi:MAG: OmpW family outer membrane protein [Pseudomonadales bacterium]